MITAADLKTRTVKDLATMARKKKVLGWHTMRKDELVRALIKAAKSEAGKRNGFANGHAKNGSTNGHAKNGSTNGHAKNGSTNGHAGSIATNGHVGNGCTNGHAGNGCSTNGHAKELKRPSSHSGAGPHIRQAERKSRSPHLERRLQQIKSKLAEAKDLSFKMVGPENVHTKDRLIVMVRDPYWLHAYWELSRRSIERAEAAMGQHWHAAHPVLRLHEVSRNGTTNSSRQAVRDIGVHGGVNNWYIDVQNPPKSYQLEIGYLAPGGRFYCLARSNVVSTPPPGSSDTFDRNWAEVAKEFDRVYAMTTGSTEQEANGDVKDVFEEHLHRPVGDSAAIQFGPGATVGGPKRDFRFHVDTELIVHGMAQPDARVTLRGEPVRLRPDGSFAVRFSLPDRRHVLPVVASSSDGAEQRTIVLAVDRNTKVMEPILRDPGD